MGSRGIALHFHDRGTRRGWMVSSTPRPPFTPGKDTVTLVQEAGWSPGPVWTGRKSLPHRDSISDLPARSQSPYRLSYPTHRMIYIPTNNDGHTATKTFTPLHYVSTNYTWLCVSLFQQHPVIPVHTSVPSHNRSTVFRADIIAWLINSQAWHKSKVSPLSL